MSIPHDHIRTIFAHNWKLLFNQTFFYRLRFTNTSAICLSYFDRNNWKSNKKMSFMFYPHELKKQFKNNFFLFLLTVSRNNSRDHEIWTNRFFNLCPCLTTPRSTSKGKNFHFCFCESLNYAIKKWIIRRGYLPPEMGGLCDIRRWNKN